MLSLLGLIYKKIIDLRNQMFDRGISRSFDLQARTISVGNLTTGGTGKTPLVAYISKMLAERGEKVCILTRGYKRKEPKSRVLVSDGMQIFADVVTAGDEPFELAHKLLGKAMVIADADRVSAGRWARQNFGVTTFVLDDGFQHRRVKRDLDIVCIDATNPFGGDILPKGRLRESAKGLGRADMVVITRSSLIDSIDALRAEVSSFNRDVPIFLADNKIARIGPMENFLTGMDHALEDSTKMFAFCGIGNPVAFFELLKRKNIDLAATHSFADHHSYSQLDISILDVKAMETGAQAFLTTAKDAVKLAGLTFTLPCFVVEIEIEINDAPGFTAMI